MEAWLVGLFGDVHALVLALVILLSLAALVKGADLLVDEAVGLSVRWGVPKMVIGATVVSLGTTLPETAVSVIAALQGAPGLALGNAVGSIIADTGLILGLAAIIGPIPVDRTTVTRQSWIQFGSAVLLVLACVPFLSLSTTFAVGGRLPRLVGVGFLVLLVLYLWRTVSWSRTAPAAGVEVREPGDERVVLLLVKLFVGIALVVVSSRVLIPAVREVAGRLQVPEAIIAATLVALGTSLPEFVTAITAVRKRHGELALGNVLGADVLNVLFVSGASAAVTHGGLEVPPQFFYLFFPSMIFVVVVLQIGIHRSSHTLSRGFGVVLLVAYVITVVLGYLVPGAPLPHGH